MKTLKFVKSTFVATVLLLTFTATANAAIITATLPEVDGGNGLIGDFVYTIPASQDVIAASFSGTFGNSSVSTSGALTLDIDGIEVAECVQDATCWFDGEAFGYIFSITEILTGFLDDGMATLTQNATAGITRLGSLTLTIETADSQMPVPVPPLFLLFGISVLGLVYSKKS